jgi:WD40 repeat protein
VGAVPQSYHESSWSTEERWREREIRCEECSICYPQLGSGVGIVGGDGEGLWKLLAAREALRKKVMSASGDHRTHIYPRLGFPMPMRYSPISGSSAIEAIAVSSDSKSIAAGNRDGVVRIWDSGLYELMKKAEKHRDVVLSLFLS